MRITRQKLIDVARRHAEETALAGPVLSAYLTGSVVSGEPVLGGAADIDLVFIHEADPPAAREVIQLTEDVHLDVAHHARSRYASPRALRVDPWLGPAVCEPIFLYDPGHFFEWAQAGARGQFHRPDHVVARARAMLDAARAAAPSAAGNGHDGWLGSYLEASLGGANAAALLQGFPAWGRRVSIALADRTAALGHPEISEGFLRLVSGETPLAWDLPAWLAAWARAMSLAGDVAPGPEFHPGRRTYHLRGFQALVEEGHPEAVLWPMLVTWNRATASLAPEAADTEPLATFARALGDLELSEPHRARRAEELEAFLDHVESVLEAWAERNGG